MPSTATCSRPLSAASRLLVLATPLVMLLALAAAPALAATVMLTEDGFVPDPVTLEPGETLEIVNARDVATEIVAADGRWSSGLLQPGEGFSVPLIMEGTSEYGTNDGQFVGTIMVVAPETEEAEDGPAPVVTGGPDIEQMPDTGIEVGPLAWRAVAALVAGLVIVLATRRVDGRRHPDR